MLAGNDPGVDSDPTSASASPAPPSERSRVYGCYRNTSPDVTLTDKYMEALSVFTAVVVV